MAWEELTQRQADWQDDKVLQGTMQHLSIITHWLYSFATHMFKAVKDILRYPSPKFSFPFDKYISTSLMWILAWLWSESLIFWSGSDSELFKHFFGLYPHIIQSRNGTGDRSVLISICIAFSVSVVSVLVEFWNIYSEVNKRCCLCTDR